MTDTPWSELHIVILRELETLILIRTLTKQIQHYPTLFSGTLPNTGVYSVGKDTVHGSLVCN